MQVSFLHHRLCFYLMGSSQKYPYSHHRRNWNFPGGGGFCKAKNVKKCMKLNWKFQSVWEVLENIPSLGEVWIFLELHNRYTCIDPLCNYNIPSVKFIKLHCTTQCHKVKSTCNIDVHSTKGENI